MPRPGSAWDRSPEARGPEPPVIGLGDPWGNRPKASIPLDVRERPARASRGSSRSDGLLIAAFFLSLFLHGAVVGSIAVASLLEKWWGWGAPPKASSDHVMEIVDLADFPALSKQIKELGRIPGTAPPPPDVPKRGQLVELAKPETPEVAPDDARFLAEHARRVEEETVSREQALTPEVLADEFKGLGKKDGSPAETAAKETLVASLGKPGANAGPGEGEGAASPEPAEKTIEDVLVKDPFGILAKKPEPRAFAGAPARPGGGGVSSPSAIPGEAAGAPNNDYLPHVRPGDKTQLNAKEFVFASFWHRVQRQVEPFWVKHVRAIRPGQIQRRDYMTRVNVALAPDGSLVAVDIVQRSGIAGWDRAVSEAFREAAPFLNPPAGLVEADGLIHMDDLGFIVSLTGGQVVHMYGDPRAGKLFPGMNEGSSAIGPP